MVPEPDQNRGCQKGLVRNTASKDRPSTSTNLNNIKCYFCGKSGHYADKCPDKGEAWCRNCRMSNHHEKACCWRNTAKRAYSKERGAKGADRKRSRDRGRSPSRNRTRRHSPIRREARKSPGKQNKVGKSKGRERHNSATRKVKADETGSSAYEVKREQSSSAESTPEKTSAATKRTKGKVLRVQCKSRLFNSESSHRKWAGITDSLRKELREVEPR